jgi:hypothetical protein
MNPCGYPANVEQRDHPWAALNLLQRSSYWAQDDLQNNVVYNVAKVTPYLSVFNSIIKEPLT